MDAVDKPPSPPPPKGTGDRSNSTRARLTADISISRLSAGLAAAGYVAGFVIVALHDQKFGIMELNPFRSRVVSAGVLFGLLVAIPVLAVSRTFQLFGLRNKSAVSFLVAADKVKYAKLAVYADFYFVCFVLSFLSGVFFPPSFLDVRPWGYLLALATVAVVAAVWVVRDKAFDSQAVGFVVLSFAAAGGLAVVGYFYWSHTMLLLSFWYYLVSMVAVYGRGLFNENQKWRTVAWDKYVLYGIGIVAIFAVGIYGRIKPSFGGGRPIPVVLQFPSGDPISGSKTARLLLVDENDYGYYVLMPDRIGVAYFVRRDLVSTIEFPNVH